MKDKASVGSGRRSAHRRISLILTGVLTPLAVLVLPLLSANVSLAQTQMQHPFQVRLSRVTDDAIMPGQAIVLRWEVTDTAGRDTTIQRYDGGKDWLQGITLSDAAGRKAPVTNLSYVPAPLIGGGQGGALVSPGSRQVGYVVLHPEWPEKASPGSYVLNISVRLPYESGIKPLPIVEQEVSLPIRVAPLSSVKMRSLAESLSVALYAREYNDKDFGGREAAITQLFALPEAYAGAVWRRVVNSEKPPQGVAVDYFFNRLILMRTSAAADVLADTWLQGLQSRKPNDWHTTLGYLGLYKMYAVGDPELRKHIQGLFLRIEGKVPPRERLEKGFPPIK